jgi:hypothetical protein
MWWAYRQKFLLPQWKVGRWWIPRENFPCNFHLLNYTKSQNLRKCNPWTTSNKLFSFLINSCCKMNFTSKGWGIPQIQGTYLITPNPKKWASDCWLTSNELLLNYIMAKRSYFPWNDDDVLFVLDQHAKVRFL